VLGDTGLFENCPEIVAEWLSWDKTCPGAVCHSHSDWLMVAAVHLGAELSFEDVATPRGMFGRVKGRYTAGELLKYGLGPWMTLEGSVNCDGKVYDFAGWSLHEARVLQPDHPATLRRARRHDGEEPGSQSCPAGCDHPFGTGAALSPCSGWHCVQQQRDHGLKPGSIDLAMAELTVSNTILSARQYATSVAQSFTPVRGMITLHLDSEPTVSAPSFSRLLSRVKRNPFRTIGKARVSRPEISHIQAWVVAVAMIACSEQTVGIHGSGQHDKELLMILHEAGLTDVNLVTKSSTSTSDEVIILQRRTYPDELIFRAVQAALEWPGIPSMVNLLLTLLPLKTLWFPIKADALDRITTDNWTLGPVECRITRTGMGRFKTPASCIDLYQGWLHGSQNGEIPSYWVEFHIPKLSAHPDGSSYDTLGGTVTACHQAPCCLLPRLVRRSLDCNGPVVAATDPEPKHGGTGPLKVPAFESVLKIFLALALTVISLGQLTNRLSLYRWRAVLYAAWLMTTGIRQVASLAIYVGLVSGAGLLIKLNVQVEHPFHLTHVKPRPVRQSPTMDIDIRFVPFTVKPSTENSKQVWARAGLPYVSGNFYKGWETTPNMREPRFNGLYHMAPSVGAPKDTYLSNASVRAWLASVAMQMDAFAPEHNIVIITASMSSMCARHGRPVINLVEEGPGIDEPWCFNIRARSIHGNARELGLLRLIPWYFGHRRDRWYVVCNGRYTPEAPVKSLIGHVATTTSHQLISFNASTCSPVILNAAAGRSGTLRHSQRRFIDAWITAGHIYGIDERILFEEEGVGFLTKSPFNPLKDMHPDVHIPHNWKMRLASHPGDDLPIDPVYAVRTTAALHAWDCFANNLPEIRDAIVIAVMGTHGDRITPDYWARTLTSMGYPAITVDVASPSAGKALLKAAELGSPLSEGWRLLEARARVKWLTKHAARCVAPITIGSGGSIMYDLRPSILDAAFPTGGGQHIIGFVTRVLYATVQTHIRPMWAHPGGVPRSADGMTPLVRRQPRASRVHAGVVLGSSTIPIPPRLLSLPIVPAGDHMELFRSYEHIHCAGGAGVMYTAALSGCEVHAWSRYPDREWVTTRPTDPGPQAFSAYALLMLTGECPRGCFAPTAVLPTLMSLFMGCIHTGWPCLLIAHKFSCVVRPAIYTGSVQESAWLLATHAAGFPLNYRWLASLTTGMAFAAIDAQRSNPKGASALVRRIMKFTLCGLISPWVTITCHHFHGLAAGFTASLVGLVTEHLFAFGTGALFIATSISRTPPEDAWAVELNLTHGCLLHASLYHAARKERIAIEFAGEGIWKLLGTVTERLFTDTPRTKDAIFIPLPGNFRAADRPVQYTPLRNCLTIVVGHVSEVPGYQVLAAVLGLLAIINSFLGTIIALIAIGATLIAEQIQHYVGTY
jgi:hypothetical protein